MTAPGSTALFQERYDRAISAFVPTYALDESEETRSARRRLMIVRDIAADRLCHPDNHTAPALTLARVMNEVASNYVYASHHDLGTAVQLCRRLLICGNTLDRLGGGDGAN